MRREALIVLVLLAATVTLAPGAVAPRDCGGCVEFAAPFERRYEGVGMVEGVRALPADPASATHLVMIFKGVDHHAFHHAFFLERLAAGGHVAVALDYTDFDADYAAAAGTAVARALYAEYPSLRTGILMGISGGMPAATLLLAEMPQKRGAESGPLFDYLVDLEGVASLVELYAEASAVAFVAPAVAGEPVAEIHAECGGPPADMGCLVERSAMFRAHDMAARGLKGAWIGHAVNDGRVGYNQAVQFAQALRASGVPVDQVTLLRGIYEDEYDSQLTEFVTGPAGQPDVDAAGHATERSDHTLSLLARAAVVGIAAGNAPQDGVQVVDRELGTSGILLP